MFVSEELVKLYGHVSPPKNIEELEAITDLPDFEDDPKVRGAVILDREWCHDHLVPEWFPLIGMRYVHRSMVVPLHTALSEIDRSPFRDYVKPKQCGVFNPRRIGWKPGNPLSFHAIAWAFDINWNENPYGRHGSIRKVFYVVEAFEAIGFSWGGRWTRPDDMHFQFGHPTIILPR